MVRRLIIHLVAAFGISLYGSPVSVSIPNMNIPRSDTVNIPIKAVGVVSSDSLIAYQAVVVFSSSIVQGVDAFKTGTMTQNWDDPVVGIKTDTLRLAGITTNQPDKRWVANDTLIKLRFIVLGELDAKTTIRIFDIKLFNINGAITISSKTDGQMTVIPNPLSRTVNIWYLSPCPRFPIRCQKRLGVYLLDLCLVTSPESGRKPGIPSAPVF
jgi:hypothetical protein